jgi:hypothetical protein
MILQSELELDALNVRVETMTPQYVSPAAPVLD